MLYATWGILAFRAIDGSSDGSGSLLAFHREVWGANLAATFQQYAFIDPYLGLFFVAEIALTLVAVALTLRARIPTIGAAALAAAGLITIPLLLARWTTQPYYVYVAAIALSGLSLMGAKASAGIGSSSL